MWLDLKICDFGLAEWLPKGTLITDGVVRGSPEFISKEVIKKEPYGRPSDVWSVGVCTFLLVCGRLPFEDPDRKVNIEQNRNLEPLFDIIVQAPLCHSFSWSHPSVCGEGKMGVCAAR